MCTFPGCQYTSPRSNNFERHLRTHTGAPPGAHAGFECRPVTPECLPTTAQQPNPRVPFVQGTNRTDAPLRAAGTPRATLARCSATAASTPGSARHGVTSPAATMPSPTSRARAPSAARRAAASTCTLFPSLVHALQSLSGYAYGPRRRPTPSGPPLSQRDLIQRPHPDLLAQTLAQEPGTAQADAHEGTPLPVRDLPRLRGVAPARMCLRLM